MKPLTELAITFPPSRGCRGACTTIADFGRYFRRCGYSQGWSKSETVALIVRRNLFLDSATGHGNEARRRLIIEQAIRLFAAANPTLTQITKAS